MPAPVIAPVQSRLLFVMTFPGAEQEAITDIDWTGGSQALIHHWGVGSIMQMIAPDITVSCADWVNRQITVIMPVGVELALGYGSLPCRYAFFPCVHVV